MKIHFKEKGKSLFKIPQRNSFTTLFTFSRLYYVILN